MSAYDEEYDKLTPEERITRDKVDRIREQAEQAGESMITYTKKKPLYICPQQPYPTSGSRSLVRLMLSYLYQKAQNPVTS